jgi:hypothetical protein
MPTLEQRQLKLDNQSLDIDRDRIEESMVLQDLIGGQDLVENISYRHREYADG